MIQNHIKSLQIKNRVKKCTYLLVLFCTIVTVFLLAFELKSADKKHINKIKASYNLSGHFYKKNLLNPFGEQTSINKLDYYKFFQLRYAQSKPPCDRTDFNSIMLSGNGDKCGAGLLKLNGLYGANQEAVDYVDLYYSKDNTTYTKVTTNTFNDDNREDALHFTLFHPGYYRAVITFTDKLNCTPPKNLNTDVNIKVNDNQYLVEKAYKTTVEQNGKMINPRIVLKNGSPVPSEICDMTGLTLEARLNLKARLEKYFKWYLDNVKVLEGYDKDTFMLPEHIDPGKLGNVHTIKVTALVGKDIKDGQCINAYIPSDEVTIKVTQLPRVNLTVSDTLIDQNGTKEYYFKGDEGTFVLKATDADGQNFNKYSWHNDKLNQEVSTASTYTVNASDLKDGDSYTVKASYTDSSHNSCTGTAKVIFKQAYKYSPTFDIKGVKINNDTAYFCKEVPKNTVINLVDQNMSNGKTAWQIILDDDPNAKIQWIVGMKDLGTPQQLDKTANTSPDIQPTINKIGQSGPYSIRINGHNLKHIYIDTNSQAYKGILIDTIVVKEPKIKDHNNGDEITICKGSKTPDTSIIIENKDPNYSVEWAINGAVQENNTTDTLTIKPQNLKIGKYTISARFKTTQNSTVCYSDPVNIIVNVYDEPSAVIAYKNFSGALNKITQNQYVCKDPNKDFTLYAKETDSLLDVPAGSIISWFKSVDTLHFTAIGEGKDTIVLKKTTQGINTIAYYRYVITHPADKGGCAATSPMVTVVNFKPSIQIDNSKPISCDNAAIKLTAVAKNANGTDIIEENSATWQYKATEADKWETVDSDNNKYSATKTGYYRVLASSYLMGKVPVNECAPSDPIYLIIQDTIKPKLSTDRTEICNEAPATLIVYDGHYKNDKRYPDNFTYKWYKDKTLIPDVTSYQYKTNKPGTYTVEVIDTATSCIGTTNPIILSELALNADFNTNKGSDKFICMDANSQDTITLTAVEQNAETYEWEVELPGNNDLIINSDRDSQVANYKNLKKIDLADFIGKKYPNEKNISGVYKITLKVGKKGCTQQVKKSITILYKTPITYTIKKSNQDIIIEKQGVYNICKNDTVTVSTNINKYSLKSGLKVKYLWYKNDNIIKTDITDKESILIITETGKYKLEVQLLDPQNEKQFCTIIGKEFTIKQSEVSADFNILNNLCIDADGKVKLSAIQKNNKSYHWAELINHSHIDLNNESYADIEVKLAVGKHVIQLTVTDENGCTDIVKKTITVTEKPQISIRADKTIICGNANSTLTAEVKGNVKAHIFNWLKYDDKNKNWIIIKTTDSNTFVVTEAGKYSVRVETIEGCKNISNTIEIQKSVIKASISTDKVTSCMDLDKEITLKAEVQEGDIIEYSWKNLSINNSVLGIGEQISTKLKNGENRIQLTLTDKLKCITVIDTTINASYKPDPKIFVQSENKNICNDKQVILKVKEPNKANAIYKSYQWQVKDVNNKWVDIHEATRDTFATGGSGTFRVIVTNSDNCKNASNSIDVKKETVTAKFTPEQDSFCFESLSTASINLQAMQEDADSYEWQVRTGDTVTHTYNGKGRDYGLDITKSGEYTITLTVKKNDCSVQAIRRIIVVAKPKIIYEYSKSILCPEQNDSLTIKTKIDYNLPVKYRWYRNNNLLQESSNTLVVKQEGTYQLKLELLDPRDSKTVICVAEGREVIIDRSHLNANFEVQNNECVNQDSADIKLIANYDNADSYNWIIKNTANSKEIKLTGKTQTKNLPIGSYTITLITKSQGCQSEKTKNIKITEKPQVKLKSSKSDNKLCTNSTITLTVESKNGHNPKYKIYKWYKYNINAWEQIENANTAVYEVKSEGSYKVEVVDENDCKGETNVIEIKKSSVDASFIVTPNNLTCLENAKHITLTANSIDSTNTYKWTNLTTGKVISTNSIVEAQLPEGKNDIKLEVINAYGCKEETTQTLNISYKPHPKIDIKHGRKAEICILIDGFGNIYTRSIVLVANKSYASESDYIKYKWQVKVREQWYDLHVNTKEYIVDKSATYRVVVTNKFNCEAISDELEVKETTIHMDFRNNVNNETEPIIDRNVDPILLCVDKNQKIKFTANENEANSYRWVITGDYHLPQTHQFKETTIDANIQGKLDVQLIMQKKSCLIDRPIKTYYVVFKPIVTIKEANDKNHLCGKDDSVRLIAEIADKIPDGWLREYKWYKKIDSEHSELVGKDSTLEVKVQGEYYVEATTVIKYSGGKKEYRCSSTSNTIKIGKKEVVATHNYTNKTEIKCLDVTLGLTSLDLRADYISETAKYKWEVKNEATNRTYTSTARTYKYDILNEGKYVIKLSVTDEDCTITSEQAIVISIQPPNFHLTDEQGKGIYCAYDTVYLRADQESTISPILELEYDWLYSDKDNVPKNQWKHIAVTKENRLLVEKTGYYRLQVKTKYGCIYETNLSVYIIKHTEVVYPNISVESCLNDNEELVIHNTTNYNGIEPQECVWNFGDGDSDYSNCSNTISHKYAQPGKYKITLTIKLRDECKFTKEFNIDYKQNYKPKAKIVIENKKDKYCQTYNIIFVDKSERKTNNYSAKWKVENQGIDVTSEVAQITADTLILTPLRSVDKDTKYIITLTAQNNISEKNSCQTSATKEVWVDAQPLIEFDDIEKEVCKDHDVIKLNGKYHYNGNKRISEHYEYSKQGENTRHKLDGYNLYPSKLGAGIFTIYYVVQVNDSNGVKPVCLEELSKVITIHDFKIPKIEIKSDHKLNKVCEGTDVLLEATEDFDNYQWYRNSELIPHATSKTLQVKKTGKYSLVVDYKFCGEKTSNFIDIVISETPLAKFAIPEELDCKDKKIKFINQSSSTSPIIKYEWDFGDRYTSNEENPIHSYVNEGTYEVSLTVTNSAGCSSTTKQLLFYRKIKPEIDFKIIASCITSPIEAYGEINTLTGKIKSVEWIVYSAGQNIKEAVVPSSNPNFKYLIPIEYEGTNLELEMKVTTDEGCVSIKRQSIKLKNAPKINIGFKKLILCSHTGYIDLKEKATPRVGGSWYLLKPGQSYNEKEIIENGLLDISSLRPATYKIILEYKDSATACIANSEAEVDIIEEPYVKIIVKGNNNNKTHADTTEINTCEGDDITLQATINIKADIKDIHYQWYKDGSSIKGQTGNEIHIKEEGTYEVHALVKNMTRCNAEAKIKINMYPKYHVVIDPKPIILCRSAEPIKLTFGSITPIPSEEVGAGHYYLSNNGAKGQEITLFDPSKYSGKVDIIYEFVSFNGCKDSKIKTIIVNSPTGKVQEELEVKEGESATIENSLSFGDGVTTTFKWIPKTYLDSDTISSPVVTPEKDMLYNLKISDGKGCMYTYKVQVRVIPNLHVPNVIVPNSGSSSNSTLHIRGIEKYPRAILTILDRFGQKVWESDPGYPTPWDGTNKNGEPLEIGTYYYILKPNKAATASPNIDSPEGSSSDIKPLDDLTGYIEIIY